MGRYRYEAVAETGEILTGEMEGASQAAVVDRLQTLGHVPLRADPVAARVGPRRPAARGATQQLAVLTHQLATLLQAGLPIDRALELAQTTLPRAADRDCLAAVLAALRSGSSLADAMAAQEGVFPRFYVGMVRAGEAGATLDATLAQLGNYLERSREAKERIKSAMVYPALVLATGLLSMAVLFVFVIPRFRPLFLEAGGRLPFSAEAVLWVSDFLGDYGLILLAAALALGLVGWRARGRPGARRAWDRWLLRLPVLGPIATKVEIARFVRTLGTLLKSGVPLLIALAMARDALNNQAIAAAIAEAAADMKQGQGLAEPLARTRVVPTLALQLVRIGEETARLEEMLLKAAEIYEEEARRSTERLLALLVPATTIALGAVVALVIGSLLSAVLSAYDLAL